MKDVTNWSTNQRQICTIRDLIGLTNGQLQQQYNSDKAQGHLGIGDGEKITQILVTRWTEIALHYGELIKTDSSTKKDENTGLYVEGMADLTCIESGNARGTHLVVSKAFPGTRETTGQREKKRGNYCFRGFFPLIIIQDPNYSILIPYLAIPHTQTYFNETRSGRPNEALKSPLKTGVHSCAHLSLVPSLVSRLALRPIVLGNRSTRHEIAKAR